ncbi:MAG: DUF885 family protein, partial [Candidatus Limnocylindrales bacterium]
MTEFERQFTAFFDEFVAIDPVSATNIGDHRHDGAWPDFTEEGRRSRLAFVDRWLAAFDALDEASLTQDDAIDRDLLVMELEGIRFAETELREETWNPLEWVYLMGAGLFPLIARDFAPLASRLTSVADRLTALPALLDGARTALVGLPDRPVGRFQTETAIEQLPGVGELIDDALGEADRVAPTDPDVATVRTRLRDAAALARTALDAFDQHLRDRVLPLSEGDARLGPDLFGRKMRHTMRSDTLTPEHILASADREYDAVRAEMVRLARELWPTWRPGEPTPADDGPLVRGVLDAIAAEHQDADALLEFCRAENARIEAFCRERDLIGLADEPMDIRWTPTFLRASGGAML